jgi:hypothetical protein
MDFITFSIVIANYPSCKKLIESSCPVNLLFVYGTASAPTYAKGGKVLSSPPKAFLLALLNADDLTAVVLTASLADTVRHAERATVGALHDAGSTELPGRRTSLVTSLS